MAVPLDDVHTVLEMRNKWWLDKCPSIIGECLNADHYF